MQAVQTGDKVSSIHSIKQRISPFGFQNPKEGSSVQNAYGGYLCIDNLLESSCTNGKQDFMYTAQKHLKLDAMPVPDGVCEPPPEVVWEITICYADGREMPTAYRIALDRKASVNDVLLAVRNTVSLSSDDEVVLALHIGNRFVR